MCVSYDKLTKIFKETTDKHAPQKKQKISGNQAPFMTKELSKQIMKRSKSKNLYFDRPYTSWPIKMKKTNATT